MEQQRALVLASGGGIGDVLLATPVLRALRSRYAHITMLVRPEHAQVITPLSADEVWLDEQNFWQLRSRIAVGNFAVGVVTWASARAAYALALAKVPIRVGQARRLYSALFTNQVLVRSESGDRTTHWTEIQLDYARALGLDGDPAPIPPLTSNGEAEARLLLEQEGLLPGNYAILHPTRGISRARSSWPTSRLAELAKQLQARFGLQVLISGSVADQESAAGIVRRALVRSIAGRVSLQGFTALAHHARYVVAMDSGPMHLAAATGVPTVGIFAMRPDQPDRWAPKGAYTAVIRPSYPCPRNHTKENCPDFACVRALDCGAVLEAVAGLLEIKGEGV